MWSCSPGQPLLSETIRRRRLSFFGHLCRADANQDHSRALQACIRGPSKDWRRRTGRPRQTWLRTVEDDLRPLNFGLASARRRAWDRPAWHTLVEAATSSWHAPERERNTSANIYIHRCRFELILEVKMKCELVCTSLEIFLFLLSWKQIICWFASTFADLELCFDCISRNLLTCRRLTWQHARMRAKRRVKNLSSLVGNLRKLHQRYYAVYRSYSCIFCVLYLLVELFGRQASQQKCQVLYIFYCIVLYHISIEHPGLNPLPLLSTSL